MSQDRTTVESVPKIADQLCRHCRQPIAFNPLSGTYRHVGGRPEQGSAWCNPARNAKDSIDESTAEPREGETDRRQGWTPWSLEHSNSAPPAASVGRTSS